RRFAGALRALLARHRERGDAAAALGLAVTCERLLSEVAVTVAVAAEGGTGTAGPSAERLQLAHRQATARYLDSLLALEQVLLDMDLDSPSDVCNGMRKDFPPDFLTKRSVPTTI
ncbi:hypothetical protein GGTG_02088, partial [Gaeumannomyces tritici R3-111a-1]